MAWRRAYAQMALPFGINGFRSVTQASITPLVRRLLPETCPVCGLGSLAVALSMFANSSAPSIVLMFRSHGDQVAARSHQSSNKSAACAGLSESSGFLKACSSYIAGLLLGSACSTLFSGHLGLRIHSFPVLDCFVTRGALAPTAGIIPS